MRTPSRHWWTCTVRWCWACAGGCSATRGTSRTRFQATFLVLVRKAPAIRDGNLLSSWLYGVAYRVARRARTQTLRRRGHEAAVAELEVAARPESTERLEIDPVLDQELNRLPEKYRAPLILCYLRGRTHDQAAEELRCPVGTVRSRLARGRDLLKRRLTRRGFAPTAAILGTGSRLPARLLVEAVPPSLVSATVKAAFGFGSAQTIQAGAVAASALALTQGVLTTMKLAQLKWIGLAVLATCLSAGGVVAVSYASSQSQDAGAAKNSASITFDPWEQVEPANKDEIAELSARLKKTQVLQAREKDVVTRIIHELNDLLDDRRVQSPPSPSPDRPNDGSRRNFPVTSNSIRELEIQLKNQLEDYDGNNPEMTHRSDVPGRMAWEESRKQVRATTSLLEGLDQDIADEIARLKLEMRRKNAERLKAEAQTEVAQTVVARNKRLNERKPGMVSTEDVARGEGEYKVATAQIQIVEAEIAEVGLRIQQLQSRQNRIKQVVALADRTKAAPPAK